MIATDRPIEIRKTTASRIHEVDWKNLGFGRVFSDHMCVIRYENGAWQTPRIEPYGPLHFSPAISALHYGQAIFEGLKAFRNDQGEVYVFRPDMNAKRLNHSARRMCMPELPEATFLEALNTLLELDKEWVPSAPGSALYIRPHMFATDEYVGVRPSETYLFVIFTCPVDKYYTGEVKVKIEPHYSRAVRGGTGEAKAAGNYGAALMPAKKGQLEGYHQLLWTDALTHEYIEESGTMNVIFKSGNTIFTPMITDSILSGITRDSVLILAREWGYEVQERKVKVAEVIDLIKNGQMDEAFGAGTAATIAPIRTFHYNGVDYSLNPSENWEFANKLSAYLERFRRGLEPDSRNWNMRIGG
ncbi:MAG: branched-chain amino acid aminotransferase [Flavobacteriales bacterium]